jgi:hypothetical protein
MDVRARRARDHRSARLSLSAMALAAQVLAVVGLGVPAPRSI